MRTPFIPSPDRDDDLGNHQSPRTGSSGQPIERSHLDCPMNCGPLSRGDPLAGGPQNSPRGGLGAEESPSPSGDGLDSPSWCDGESVHDARERPGCESRPRRAPPHHSIRILPGQNGRTTPTRIPSASCSWTKPLVIQIFPFITDGLSPTSRGIPSFWKGVSRSPPFVTWLLVAPRSQELLPPLPKVALMWRHF